MTHVCVSEQERERQIQREGERVCVDMCRYKCDYYDSFLLHTQYSLCTKVHVRAFVCVCEGAM